MFFDGENAKNDQQMKVAYNIAHGIAPCFHS